MTETFEGGCACGAVRYRMSARPMFVHCCHCRDCQRQTGSGFAFNGLVERDRIETLSGATAGIGVPTDSGRPHEIHRCPHCQTAVWSHYGGFQKLAFVRLGTLDRPSDFTPDVHIYTRSKLPWVSIPEGALAFDAYYDSKKVWPEESLARRKALFG